MERADGDDVAEKRQAVARRRHVARAGQFDEVDIRGSDDVRVDERVAPHRHAAVDGDGDDVRGEPHEQHADTGEVQVHDGEHDQRGRTQQRERDRAPAAAAPRDELQRDAGDEHHGPLDAW